MYVPLLLSTILVLGFSTASPIDCPPSMTRWCDTKETAERCGVTEQCERYVWNVKDQYDRVNFTLYYETLCPDCRQFVSTQLWSAFQSISSIMNISFVPYGNARETYRPETQLYQFYCQHGSDECYGNLIHTCALNFYPNTSQHLPFIYCTESTDGEVETVAMQCADTAKLDYKKISSCIESRAGNQLQHMYAVQTENLQPAHQYVPWVTINGEHTEDMEAEAEKDLIGLICQTYKGSNPPAACKTRQ